MELLPTKMISAVFLLEVFQEQLNKNVFLIF